MKKFSIFLTLLYFFSMPNTAQDLDENSYRLFYLGVQSNMDGYGFNSELPDTLTTGFDDVWIYHGNPADDGNESGGLGLWAPLQPGHGVGFSSDGSKNAYSNRFGMELSFVKALKALYPNEKIALIKYSKGGTSIDQRAADEFGAWDPEYDENNGINQYDHFLTTVRGALANTDIDGDGIEEILIPSGILWMQGESDAVFTEEIAADYYQNLSHLLGLIRASFHNDDIPIVLGKISESWKGENGKVWTYGELIQHAQEKFVRKDQQAAIVRDTRFYNYADPWHYDSDGYIRMGKDFARVLSTILAW